LQFKFKEVLGTYFKRKNNIDIDKEKAVLSLDFCSIEDEINPFKRLLPVSTIRNLTILDMATC
jgi:hypothetical protein